MKRLSFLISAIAALALLALPASAASPKKVPVAQGGTNLGSGTSGGVLGFTGSGVIASSPALTANNPVIGGGAGATPLSGAWANPTGTAGPSAVNGSATTFMRSDAAPAVQKASNAQFGLAEGDGVSLTCAAGVCSGSYPVDTAQTAGFSVGASQMGKMTPVNISGGGVITLSATGFGSTVFAAGQTWCAINTNTTVDTITNSTGATVTPSLALALPNGLQPKWQMCLQSDGTNLYLQVLAPDPVSLSLKQTFTAQQSSSVTTLAISTATFTPDGSNNNYAITLVHASCPCTLANPSATPVAGTSGQITVKQSATGSDAIGTFGSQYQAPGGTAAIVLSTGANAQDVLSYYVQDSTHILLLPAYNFSH